MMATCAECGRAFPQKNRRVTCSPECALERKKRKDRVRARKAYQRRRNKSGTLDEQIPRHQFPCPWATGAITDIACMGMDPVLGF